MRRWPRRPSMKPENIKRRLTNRVASIVAALIIAAAYTAWNKWTAPEAPATPSSAPATTEQSAPTRPKERKTADEKPKPGADGSKALADEGNARLAELIAAQRGNEVLTISARVKKILPDDNEGSPHQRFLVKVPGGGTVLVAHNIGLAPRVAGIAAGDEVTLHGEFEWNEQGGVIHWTHRDPAGRHEDGWIEFAGQRFE